MINMSEGNLAAGWRNPDLHSCVKDWFERNPDELYICYTGSRVFLSCAFFFNDHPCFDNEQEGRIYGIDELKDIKHIEVHND